MSNPNLNFSTLLQRATSQLIHILTEYQDLAAVKNFKVVVDATQDVPTEPQAEVNIKKLLILTDSVIENLHDYQRTLQTEKQCRDTLRAALSDASELSRGEPFQLIANLHNAMKQIIDHTIESLADDVELIGIHDASLLDFQRRLHQEFGPLRTQEQIQQRIKNATVQFDELLKKRLAECKTDLTRRLENAKAANSGFRDTATQKLQQSFSILTTAEAYIDSVRDPDLPLQRITACRSALVTCKEGIEAEVVLYTKDRDYLPALQQTQSFARINDTDRQHFTALFGGSGTTLEQRLRKEPDAVDWKAARKRWQGQIHFAIELERDILQHACDWIERLLDHMQQISEKQS